MKIALIEDEKDYNAAIAISLRSFGYEVYSFYNLESFFKEYKKIFPDLIISDIWLPDGNFLEELEKRDDLSYVKVLIITGYDDIEYMKKAFSLGAEEFLRKPFDYNELYLRIQKIFKDTKKLIHIKDDLFYDTEQKILLKGKEKINLTQKEAILLELLLKNRKKILSADILIDYIWQEDKSVNTLNVLIKRLREKLGDKDIIKTKRDAGYYIE